jgi:Fe-S-cluster containining protein
MSDADFEKRHVYRTRNQRRLRMKRGKCPFLLSDGCSIHTAKPTQCRLFPFWPELVSDRKQWTRVGRYCPGIGVGKLVQIGTAMETASEMERAYPSMYGGVSK